MTDRRCTTPRFRTAVAAAMGTCLLVGCGALPGGSGGPTDTITVMTFAPQDTKATNMPGMTGMAKVYESWVNAAGGINGHKLRVITCNEKNTPSGAADCARKAIAEKVVAVVGSYSQHGRAFMAPLEVEGIPFIGGYGVSAEEFQSNLSFPVNGGQPVLLAGAGRQLGRACSQVALVRPDTLAGDSMPVLLNAGLKSDGAGKAGEAADIRAAEDSADFTAQARQALASSSGGKERGCVTAVLGQRTETFFDAFRRADDKKKNPQIASVLGSVSQSLIDRTGGRESPFEGALVTSWYPVSGDPLWQPMRKVISEHAFGNNAVDPDDSGTQTTWIAYTVLGEALKRLKSGEAVTPHKVTRALNQAEPVRTGGLTPELNWRYENMRALAGFPRIVNGRVTFQVVQSGRLVTQQGEQPMDMTQTLEQAPRAT
ncbi:ABC transporter substrate-binding protein [Streptomyces sp. NPDC090445]|uniref:ABC transporter substrate-binding protein n=1 Tax=Streptomyces sp. NPDC090445 TaxID=3365963 RepID=UPI00382D2F9A